MSNMRTLRHVLLVALLGLTVASTAATDDLSQYLRDDHPDVYTVVKGDTLWDISG